MPYNDNLADRLREALVDLPKVEEKKMFRGLTFMVNGKMCISVSGEELMVRFDQTRQEEIAERKGFRQMKMGSRKLKGFCYVSEEGYKSTKDLIFWVDLALAFNPKAKASPKKTRKKV